MSRVASNTGESTGSSTCSRASKPVGTGHTFICYRIQPVKPVGTTQLIAEMKCAMEMGTKGRYERLILSSQVLIHFNPEEIVLVCDAFVYGISTVMSHRLPDGSEQPISFASCSLTDTEQRYAQMEKEGLVCILEVTRFHLYLYGHQFELVMNIKALLSLLHPKHPISPQASGWIQRWALRLTTYKYTLVFHPTALHGNADTLRRLPLPDKPEDVPIYSWVKVTGYQSGGGFVCPL